MTTTTTVSTQDTNTEAPTSDTTRESRMPLSGHLSEAKKRITRSALAQMVDHTLLKTDATRAQVSALVAEAHAFDAAAQLDAPLTAIHVWSDNDLQRRNLRHLFDLKPWDRMRDTEERVLAERLAGWSQRYPSTTVQRVVEHSDPAKSLVDHSGAAALVVVATRGWRTS